MTLSPKLGVVGISTLWHFRLPLPIQMLASSPRLSGIGMPSPILWSHPLKMQRIVLLSSLLWWELGTNSLITGPGEWLSFRRFTSKLSWSWSCLQISKSNIFFEIMCQCTEGSHVNWNLVKKTFQEQFYPQNYDLPFLTHVTHVWQVISICCKSCAYEQAKLDKCFQFYYFLLKRAKKISI